MRISVTMRSSAGFDHMLGDDEESSVRLHPTLGDVWGGSAEGQIAPFAGAAVGGAGVFREPIASVEGSHEVILIAEAFAEFVGTRDCIFDRQ